MSVYINALYIHRYMNTLYMYTSMYTYAICMRVTFKILLFFTGILGDY